MKATCIVGSPRPQGSCAYLIDTLIKGMNENGAETKNSVSAKRRFGIVSAVKNVT